MSKQIGFLGHGVFGTAVGSLVEANGHLPEYVDVGDAFTKAPDILFVIVPVQHMRQALIEHVAMLNTASVIVNCSKGIEQASGMLPYQIITEVLGERAYVSVAGPSFASEIIAKVPTTVTVTGSDTQAVAVVRMLLEQPFFKLEELGTLQELELASAMKNIYAVASGYVAGSGGGKNTHAHMQVVALREYTALIHALSGTTDVVRPGIVGDLILTCGSAESRNYQYGHALATGVHMGSITAEGVASAEAITIVSEAAGVTLPLASSVRALVAEEPHAQKQFYQALGFNF